MTRRLAACLLVALMPMSAHSDRAVMEDVTIRKVVVTTEEFGGCIVAVDNIQELLPNCKPWWVSLGCRGPHHEPADAERLYDLALDAFKRERRFDLYVDDSRTYNGYCLAYRIDIDDLRP